MDHQPPSDRRTALRSPIIVTQAKMGDERRYFFGYARNLSRSGIFIQTVTPKNPGEEFSIEFTIPKTDISVRCRAKVVWARRFSESGGSDEPGMGLEFLELDPEVSARIEEWVLKQVEGTSHD